VLRNYSLYFIHIKLSASIITNWNLFFVCDLSLTTTFSSPPYGPISGCQRPRMCL